MGTPCTIWGDLNVTLIERTPRYDYDASKNQPEPNDIVTFHGHIINWSGTTVSPEYVWKIDGVPVEEGAISNLAPIEERILVLEWVWTDGDHFVSLTVDPQNLIAESSEENNLVEDRVNALITGFWVEQSLYDYFHQYQHELGIGSNSWQDWIQRQMARQNELYQQAVWSIAPQGVLDRVRIDKIVVVPDGALPLNGGLPSNHPDTSDKTVDLMWGFPATLLNGSFYSNHTAVDDNNPFYIEKSLIHELGHARYLIDCYGFDVHNTASHHSVQIWEGDTYVAGSDYMPFLAWGEVLYYNQSGGVMTGPYGFNWSPYEAAALNLIAGQRAVCGNYNAPCNIGVFLQDLPQNNHVRFIDTEGKPWAGAGVRIYQTQSGPDWYGKTIDNNWDQQYATDLDGYIHLPRNPFNPGGNIIHTCGQANGVMILRIAFGNQIWYRFMEVSEFNMQYWLGNFENANYTIELDGLNYEDTTPPTVPAQLSIQKITSNQITLTWEPSTDNVIVLGYNIYRDDVLIGSSDTTSFEDNTVVNCSSYYYTVTAYDAFNESEPSDPCQAAVPGPAQDSDFNNDQQINLIDMNVLCKHWLGTGCNITGDLNADAEVNLLDFIIFSADYLSLVDKEINWPMRQRDMHHTGRANYTVPASRLNDTFFDTILWQQPSPGSPGAGNFSSTSMVFYDNVGSTGEDVVVGGYHWPKGIQAMDRQSGTVLWYGNPQGGETIGQMTPAFSNDGKTIYVVNDATSHPLMAFATTTGPTNYRHNGGDAEPDRLQLCSPTIGPSGRIWLHQWNDRPYAGTDNTTSISQTWAAATVIYSCLNDPTLYQNSEQLLVVSGGRTDHIKAWDGQTGTELWSVSNGVNLPTDATATIDPANGNIYLPYGFDDIYVVGLNKDGQMLWANVAMSVYDWQLDINNPQRAISVGCLSNDGATYYFQTNSSSGDGALYAINTADGSVKWSYPTQSRGWEIHSSSPTVTRNGVIVVGNNKGNIYWAILDNGSSPVLLDSYTVALDGTAQAGATLSPDGLLYLPLRTTWTVGNGDGETPTGNIENVFTAFDLH